MRTVPPAVLAAYGVTAAPVALEGGQGTSVRAGNLVLKPGADPAYVAWLHGLCARVRAAGFRLPAPVAALDGRLVVDGWTATSYAAGEPVHDDDRSTTSWLPVLAAGRALHAALRDEQPPGPTADHRWALADRAAWGGAPLDHGPRSAPLLARLRGLVLDEGLEPQLVHGDLSGNVLLAPGLEPAVIDVSPYWRPAAYADAVVAVDAALWWRTDPDILRLARPDGLDAGTWASLLARALAFRLLAFDEGRRDPALVAEELPRYAEIVDLLVAGP